MSTTEGRRIDGVDLTGATWRKASASNANGGGCFELATAGDAGEVIALRDSKDPEGPALFFTRHELACFLDGAKAGEFDDMI